MSKPFQFKDNKKYYKLHKPYGVLSQFTPDHLGQKCLKDIINVSDDVYPVGRLDKDSEGLLLLSNDRAFNAYILHPKMKKVKEYWVQLDGAVTAEAIDQLKEGLRIRIKGKEHFVNAHNAKILDQTKDTLDLPERDPPIRFRKDIPTTWVSISLTQGKNRQVRRMCAKVGFPVLRLVRVKISNWELKGMDVGQLDGLH